MRKLFNILFLAFISSLVVFSCGKHYVALQKITAFLSDNSNNQILENDTTFSDTLVLAWTDSISYLDNKNQCFIPNPIGALMSFSYDSYFCHKINNVTITSYYDFNSFSAGESLNDLFITPNSDETVAQYLDRYYNNTSERDYNLVNFYCVSKPEDPLQKFQIVLETDKGTFTSETPTFYWY